MTHRRGPSTILRMVPLPTAFAAGRIGNDIDRRGPPPKQVSTETSRAREPPVHHPLSVPVSRRHTLAALGAGTAGIALAGPAAALQGAPKSGAQQLLDSIADNLLAHSPEGATSLGIDTGDRAAMRARLGDRSAAGVH